MLRFAPSSAAAADSAASTIDAGLLAATATPSSGAHAASLCRWELTCERRFRCEPVARLPETAPVRCVAWGHPSLLAFGASSGRVAVAEISFDDVSPGVSVVAEFVQKPPRACTIVAFAPIGSQSFSAKSNVLLAVLNKFRNEASILIWDITRAGSTAANPSIAQLATNDVVSSAAWLPSSSQQCFLAGVSGKHIKMFDLRASSDTASSTSMPSSINSLKLKTMIASRFVNGLCLDPFDELRFASFSEYVTGSGNNNSSSASSGVSIWDLRKTSEPTLVMDVLTKNSSVSGRSSAVNNSAFMRGGVGAVEWCATRRDVLVASAKESLGAIVWDLRVGPSGEAVSSTFAGDSLRESPTTPPSQPPSRKNSGVLSLPNFPSELESGPLTTAPVLWSERRIKFGDGGESNLGIANAAAPLSAASGSPAISWIPIFDTECDMLIAMNCDDGKLYVVDHQSAPLASWGFSPASKNESESGSQLLTVTSSFGRVSTLENIQPEKFKSDIEFVMKWRAMRGYGLDIDANLFLLQDIPSKSAELVEIWVFLKRMKVLNEEGQSIIDSGLFGIAHMMKSFGATRTMMPITGYNTSESQSPTFITYFSAISSDFRSVGAKLCNRYFEADGVLETLIKTLESQGKNDDAAGYALFYSSSIEKALKCLESSSDEKLRLVAVSLFSHMNTPLPLPSAFIRLCEDLSNSLRSPFLRVLFSLLANNGSWKVALLKASASSEDNALSLEDTIGAALRYLPDDELLQFLDECTEKVLTTRQLRDSGTLGAVALCGLAGENGVRFLQAYLNSTADVQTAALVGLLAGGLGRRSTDVRVLECYRDFLDQLQLFHERANLDIAWAKFSRAMVGMRSDLSPSASSDYTPDSQSDSAGTQVPLPLPAHQPQIHVRCNYCNTPISQNYSVMQGNGGGGPPSNLGAGQYPAGTSASSVGGAGSSSSVSLGGMVGNSKKAGTAANCCPACKRPLPRCALCLMHIGTPVEPIASGG
ncbi:hypothetical protein HDU82_001781 [Entophlyctis luteolus]|nr:hypothetical protein HDU82_001781 [Entophlyctis luteolus]